MELKISRKHYKLFLAIVCFYLFAQIFQQYVVRLGPMSAVSTMEETIIAGQHYLNIARLSLILLSMFLMVIGFVILTQHFYQGSSFLSIISFVFFIFFCLFEIGYRSVELFQVVMVWGKEFVQASADVRSVSLSKFKLFGEVVDALYFPLLLSHFIASVALTIASYKVQTGKLVAIAMGINSVRLLLRLTGYTQFSELNILSGVWYFPPVAVVLILLIAWSWMMIKANKSALP